MTETTLKKKVENLGGTVEFPAWLVSFPETLRINTKSQAIDLLDIIIHGKEAVFIRLDIPLEALKAATAFSVSACISGFSEPFSEATSVGDAGCAGLDTWAQEAGASIRKAPKMVEADQTTTHPGIVNFFVSFMGCRNKIGVTANAGESYHDSLRCQRHLSVFWKLADYVSLCPVRLIWKDERSALPSLKHREVYVACLM